MGILVILFYTAVEKSQYLSLISSIARSFYKYINIIYLHIFDKWIIMIFSYWTRILLKYYFTRYLTTVYISLTF